MIDRESFLKTYNIHEYLERAEAMGLKWPKLEGIFSDYIENYYDDYKQKCGELIEELYSDVPEAVNIIYGRAKDPQHLVEKIIRKVGKEQKLRYKNIDVSNYRETITDLIGIRVLVLSKEDWRDVDDHIKRVFAGTFIEDPKAYVCYGDRDVYGTERVAVDYTIKGYRSIHYVIRFKNVPCEIQVRTLAEEVYGEFDHRSRYPYHEDNNFLGRYNRTVSKVTSMLDDLISTGLSIPLDDLNCLGKSFVEDHYIDWKKYTNESIENETVKEVKYKQGNALDIATGYINDREGRANV